MSNEEQDGQAAQAAAASQEESASQNRDERQALVVESLAIQAKMEGVFRQLYQGATQQSIANNIWFFRKLLEHANGLFKEMEFAASHYSRLEQKDFLNHTHNTNPQ